MRAVLLYACLSLAAYGASLPDPALARWIAAQGGRVETDSSGRITAVHLGFTWTTDRDVARLAELAGLRKLDLSLSLVTDAGMERLKGLSELTDLNLYAVEHITDVAVAYIRGWRRLERLNLRGTDITDTSLQYVSGLTGLKSLDVSYTQVTNNGMEYLGGLRNLEDLALGGNKITGAGLHVLKLLPSLRRLNLDGNQKRNSGTWVVSLTDLDLDTIGGLRQLQALDLGGTKVTDLGLAKLAGLARLRRLDLSRTPVSGKGLAMLASLPALESLSLWKAGHVDDSAAGALAAVKGLADLDLSDTGVTDRTLERLQSMTGLRSLRLSGSKVSEAGVTAFERALPRCQVSWR